MEPGVRTGPGAGGRLGRVGVALHGGCGLERTELGRFRMVSDGTQVAILYSGRKGWLAVGPGAASAVA